MRVFMILLMLVAFVKGDYLMHYKMGEEKGTFYYKDETHQKLQAVSDICKGGEVYKTPKGIYAVNYADGELMIIDMMQARSFMQSMGVTGGASQTNDKRYDPYAGYEIKKTSQSKHIAGLKAYKWILTDKKSKKRYTLYVSDDKNLAKITKAFYKLFTAAIPQSQSNFLLENRYVIVEGDGYELLSFKKVSKADSFYNLPTKNSKIVQKCKKESAKEEVGEPVHHKARKESVRKKKSQEEMPSADDIEKAAELLKNLF